MQRGLRVGLVMLAVVAGSAVLAQGPIKPLAQVPARSDSNAYLMVTAEAGSGQGPIAPLAQVNGRSDSNGYLYVTLAGGTATPNKLCLDSTNQDACLQRNGAGVLQLGNAATSTDFGRLQLGGSTASFPSLKRSGTDVLFRLADDSGDSGIRASVLTYTTRIAGASGSLVMSGTAPSISSGFGTSPSVPSNNGSAAFTVNVGTGGTASAGVIAMPTAATGWNCSVVNRTALAAGRASQSTTAGTTWQTATTTTTVTVTNLNLATGGAVAWAASDILALTCTGY